MNMSSMNCVSFEAGIDDISILTATVTSPSGHEEPCVLKKLPNNRMGKATFCLVHLASFSFCLRYWPPLNQVSVLGDKLAYYF